MCVCLWLSGIWRCASLSCEHRCHASPEGGTCSCPPGYIVNNNNSRSCIGEYWYIHSLTWKELETQATGGRIWDVCFWLIQFFIILFLGEDFDDCTMWGVCDQLCEDRMGTHRCSCREGYFLEQHRYCSANISSEWPWLSFNILQHIKPIPPGPKPSAPQPSLLSASPCQPALLSGALLRTECCFSQSFASVDQWITIDQETDPSAFDHEASSKEILSLLVIQIKLSWPYGFLKMTLNGLNENKKGSTIDLDLNQVSKLTD